MPCTGDTEVNNSGVSPDNFLPTKLMFCIRSKLRNKFTEKLSASNRNGGKIKQGHNGRGEALGRLPQIV